MIKIKFFKIRSSNHIVSAWLYVDYDLFLMEGFLASFAISDRTNTLQLWQMVLEPLNYNYEYSIYIKS